MNLEKELEDLEIESIKISALDKHYEDFNRGLEAYDNGDHEQAILCFKQITTEIDSELYAKAQLVLGIIYAEKDHTKGAIECWKQVPESEMDIYAQTQFNLGIIYQKLGSYEKAIEHWKQVPKTKSALYANAIFNIGIVYREQGDFEKAIEFWRQVPDNEVQTYAQAQFNLGLAYQKLDDCEKAIEHWKKIPKNRSALYADAIFNIGIVYREQGDLRRAIEFWKKVPDSESKNYAQAQFILGLTFQELGDIKKAIKHWNKVSESQIKLYVQAQFNLSATYEISQNFEKEIEHLLRVPSSEEKFYARAQVDLGTSYQKMGNIDKTIDCWQKIPDSAGEDYAIAQLKLGFLYYDHKKIEEAISCWLRVPKSEFNEYSLAQLLLGITYLDENDVNERISKLGKHLPNISQEAEIYKNFGYHIRLTLKILNTISDNKKIDFIEIFEKVEQLLKYLHVNSEYENLIAHYTNLTVSKLLLSQDKDQEFKSPLRLNTINLMNDPEEGLLLNKLLCVNEEITTQDLAFIACFTLHHDSLNQFRLYSKEGQQEASGLSLVLNKNFFSKEHDVARIYEKIEFVPYKNIRIEQKDMELSVDINKIDANKFVDIKLATMPLYRCIYFDPTSGLIKIAQREEWSFRREYKVDCEHQWFDENPNADKKWKEYINGRKETKKYQKLIGIKEIEVNVRDGLKALSESIKQIQIDSLSSDEKELLAEILLPLRYLMKHMAFKEEQECRIVYVTQMDNPLIQYDEKINRIFVDYAPSIMEYLEKIYLAPKASGEKMVFEYLCSRGQIIRKGKEAVKVKISQNPFR
ncbi:tetratricopeptide repeat protein [Acinetobacter johnsonii]|uniref:tetratricopeptide repeat protein n=1 Tax=Acinetobacter johnsonii TaxID=40214 RepID=UPI002FD8D9D0|nr:tetratricopeptide repeat protein [Acinetobacter johnsonii]